MSAEWAGGPVFSLAFRIGGVDGSLDAVPRILVIEDHEPLRESAVRILSAAGYDVRAASSGAEGLRAWRELGADLVLTDARMGDVSGLEIILQLRAAAPHLPVILMSGDLGASAYLVRDVPGSGALSFLAKPFRKTELLAAAASALAQARTAAEQ